MSSPDTPSLKRSLKPLLISFLCLVVLESIAYISGEHLLSNITGSLVNWKTTLSVALQMALWISGAFFTTFIVNHVLLERTLASLFSGGKVPQLVKNVCGLLIFATAIICIIAFVFNKQVAGIWATSGVVGVVLGLALQSMIRDMFTGMAVNIDKPFVIGDFITIHPPNLVADAGVKGIVQEINWRTTKLLTPANTHIYIPNSIIGTSTLTNHSTPTTVTEVKVSLILAFSEEPERAQRILESAALAVCSEHGPVLLSPPPKVRIHTINADGIEYRIAFMVARSPGPARDLLYRSLLRHMHQTGLSLANPQHDLNITRQPRRAAGATSVRERVEMLRRMEIFAPLTEEELYFLTGSAKQLHPAKGEVIFKAGTENPAKVYSMYVLLEGLLYASMDVTHDGHEVQVGQILPGEFFGEMSLLTGVPRSATITAATDALIYEITQESMAELLKQRPELMENLSLVMAERRLRNERTQDQLSGAAHNADKANLADQLFATMKNLFGHIWTQNS